MGERYIEEKDQLWQKLRDTVRQPFMLGGWQNPTSRIVGLNESLFLQNGERGLSSEELIALAASADAKRIQEILTIRSKFFVSHPLVAQLNLKTGTNTSEISFYEYLLYLRLREESASTILLHSPNIHARRREHGTDESTFGSVVIAMLNQHNLLTNLDVIRESTLSSFKNGVPIYTDWKLVIKNRDQTIK
jgi:hypothetical protein